MNVLTVYFVVKTSGNQQARQIYQSTVLC